ncbi:unnamed protein product [Umbelopsis ramanniana]
MPTLTASYTSAAPEYNSSYAQQIEFSGRRNDRGTANGDDAEVEEDEEEEVDEESGDPDGGLVKTTESNGRAKRPKTN